MVGRLVRAVLVLLCMAAAPAWAQTERVVDIPTRPGVTQRILVLGPEKPKAAVILFAGGHGGLMLTPQGEMGWGKGNFLVRTRESRPWGRILSHTYPLEQINEAFAASEWHNRETTTITRAALTP